MECGLQFKDLICLGVGLYLGLVIFGWIGLVGVDGFWGGLMVFGDVVNMVSWLEIENKGKGSFLMVFWDVVDVVGVQVFEDVFCDIKVWGKEILF